MAISQRAAGTWASHSTTQNVQVPFPSGYTPIVGDIGIVVGTWKAFGTTATVNQGWSEIFDLASGSTAGGNGTGSVRLYAAYKVFTSTTETAPTISRSTTPAPGGGVMIVLQKGAAEAWVVTQLSNATEQAMGSTAMSHVCTTTAGITSGDWVFALTGVADESATFTRATTAISGGPTWSGNVVEYPSAHLSTTDSNDLAADLIYRVASSTVASGQSITITATLTAAERVGSALFSVRAKAATSTSVAEVSLGSATEPSERTNHSIKVRARVQSGVGTLRAALYESTNNRSGDLETTPLTTSLADYTLSIPDASAANITDYSDLSVRFWGYDAFAGAATVFEVDQLYLDLPTGAADVREADVTTTGGGVATVSAAKRGQLTYAATGGGVLTPSSVTVRTRTQAVTGGGIATAVQTTTRTRSDTATGGGVTTPIQTTIRTATVTATGGGVATVDHETIDLRMASIVATGGGVATAIATTTRTRSDTATGAGVATVVQTTARAGTVAATGAGIGTVDGQPIHPVTVMATGAGVATASGAKRAHLTNASTGGGIATAVQTTVRTASVEVTGGGTATVDGENPSSGVVSVSVEVTGGGVASVVGSKLAYLTLSATGGGVTVPVGTKRAESSPAATGAGAATTAAGTIRSASPAATGGGTIPVDAETWRLASVLVTGGGAATVAGGPFVPDQPGSLELTEQEMGSLSAILSGASVASSTGAYPSLVTAVSSTGSLEVS